MYLKESIEKKKKLASEQSMMKTITQTAIRTTKAVIMVAREVENTTIQQIPRVRGPVLKQPTLNWKAPDKYHKFNNFEIEVRYLF